LIPNGEQVERSLNLLDNSESRVNEARRDQKDGLNARNDMVDSPRPAINAKHGVAALSRKTAVVLNPMDVTPFKI
jgi:hypothetical protein